MGLQSSAASGGNAQLNDIFGAYLREKFGVLTGESDLDNENRRGNNLRDDRRSLLE
jgi:hypothetical protein